MNPTNRYRYEMPVPTVALFMTLCLGISASTAYLAWACVGGPKVGLIALSVVFAALVLVVLSRLTFPRVLELTNDAVLFPSGLPWGRITTIPYADIIRIVDCGDCLAVGTSNGSFSIGDFRFEGYRGGAGDHFRQDRDRAA